MDKELLEQWLKKMGYNGRIPQTMKLIYNNKTSTVWNQIIKNVKPMDEIKNYRKRIIVNRLKTSEDKFQYPLKEIEIYQKKKRLMNEIKEVTHRIKEKGNTVDQLLKENDVKYLNNKNLRRKIRETEERIFLNDTKMKHMEMNLKKTDDILALTPVEMEEDNNPHKVKELLQQCAKKLECLAEQLNPQTAKPPMSVKKSLRKACLSERKSHFMEVKRHASKSVKCLYPEEIKENIPSILNDNNTFGNEDVKNRFSLGIINDGCLQNIEADDFLMNDSFFSETKKLSKEYDSELFSFNHTTVYKCNNLTLFENDKSENKINTILNKAMSDNETKTLMKEIFYKNSKFFTWNNVNTFWDDILLEIIKTVYDFDNSFRYEKDSKEEDIAKLHFQHVKYELQTLKSKKNCKILSKAIEKTKQNLEKNLVHLNHSDAILKNIEFQIKNVAIDAKINFLKKEINTAKKTESLSDFQFILAKVGETKNDITNKVTDIHIQLDTLNNLLENTEQTRHSVIVGVKRISHIICDLDWSAVLVQNLAKKDFEVFSSFPFEYNKRLLYTEPKVYHRDIVTDDINIKETNDKDIFKLVTILDQPYSPPEITLRLLARKIRKLNALNNVKFNSSGITYQKYSINELSSKENYIQDVVRDLFKFINCQQTRKILQCPSEMEQLMKLWLDMPFKECISEKNVVEGYHYSYFDKQFSIFFQNLK